MDKASRELDASRAARDRAKGRFNLRLARARQDMTTDALADRLIGQFKRRARDTFDEAVEIADENRAVVAGTIAALAVWFLRRPILAWLDGKRECDGKTEDITNDAE